MQTWARRGVQAALVTGGMLAVGTGVASATETCPHRPSLPLGESFLPPSIDDVGDGTPRYSGPCFAGELFPEEVAAIPAQATAQPVQTTQRGNPATVLFGTIDPVRDLLPAVENATTQQMPVITDQHWIPPQRSPKLARPLELAGWVADTADGAPADELGRVPEQSDAAFDLLPRDPQGKHAKPTIGTPAEGFHRSLSWSGPIGEVVRAVPPAVKEGAFPGGTGTDVPPALVMPSGDPAVVDPGFEQADGIVALWEQALGRTPAGESAHNVGTGLLSPGAVDLTSGRLAEPRSALHTVPHSLLHDALSTFSAARPQRAHEAVPLEVPGEHQEQAAEVPTMSGPLTLPKPAVPQQREATERSDTKSPGVQAPLPVLGELNALDGAQTSVPQVSRITEALEGKGPALPVARSEETATPTIPRMRAYTGPSQLSDVAVTVVDELAAAAPAQRQVSENPYRSTRTARSSHPGGMALPVLGGGLPEVSPVQTGYLPSTTVDPAQALNALNQAGSRPYDSN